MGSRNQYPFTVGGCISASLQSTTTAPAQRCNRAVEKRWCRSSAEARNLQLSVLSAFAVIRVRWSGLAVCWGFLAHPAKDFLQREIPEERLPFFSIVAGSTGELAQKAHRVRYSDLAREHVDARCVSSASGCAGTIIARSPQSTPAEKLRGRSPCPQLWLASGTYRHRCRDSPPSPPPPRQGEAPRSQAQLQPPGE